MAASFPQVPSDVMQMIMARYADEQIQSRPCKKKLSSTLQTLIALSVDKACLQRVHPLMMHMYFFMHVKEAQRFDTVLEFGTIWCVLDKCTVKYCRGDRRGKITAHFANGSKACLLGHILYNFVSEKIEITAHKSFIESVYDPNICMVEAFVPPSDVQNVKSLCICPVFMHT